MTLDNQSKKHFTETINLSKIRFFYQRPRFRVQNMKEAGRNIDCE